MLWEPVARTEVVNVAVDEFGVAPVSATVPIGRPPALNVTDPVGWADALISVTVATRVAVWPSLALVGAVRTVVVLSAANAETVAHRKAMQRDVERSEPPRSVDRDMNSPFLDSNGRSATKSAGGQ